MGHQLGASGGVDPTHTMWVGSAMQLGISDRTGQDMERTLNDEMEFDHVVRVHADGTVTDAEAGLYAPEMNDDAVEGDWSLMTGYSGQDRYSGPTMHASESIGGQMERDILSTPGVYVAVISYMFTDDDDDDGVAGWGVAYMADDDDKVGA